MHRALLVSEVLLEIFEYFNQILDPWPPGGKRPYRNSLAALARTCKTFHEPAMNLLWADLSGEHGIHPLLGCVPRLHAMMYRRKPIALFYFRFEGVEPLSEHEVHQFSRHAARVRSLRVASDDNNLHLFSSLPIMTCLFPKLLWLNFSVMARNRSHHLFLSPTLRRCVLPVFHPDLTYIGIHCTVLEELSISDSYGGAADEFSILSDTIPLCKRLVTLRCPPLNWTAWKLLSTFPTLLTVTMGGGTYYPLDQHDLNLAPFLSLTALSFLAVEPAYVISVMERSKFPSLKKFNVCVGYLPWAQAEQLVRALTQCNTCKTLEQITIFQSYIRYQGAKEFSNNSLTAIRQFLCFTKLQNLQLAFESCSIYLDNDLLLEAMASWPHIRVLRLAHPRSPPAVTFRGLLAALRLRPHLNTMRISMDCRNIDIDPAAESFQHTSLQMLDLTSSYVEDTETVARIIFSVFPLVDRVQLLIGGYMPRVWNEVNKHLQSFRASVVGPHITEVASKTRV
ncbi:hypothetical protein EDB19DRAFT_1189997 [Suillus lakei]|nr:hypothetical protein EDB19DRAFT_1189997 [Suillus lakei]